MHEFSLVQSILEAAFEVARQHGDLPIRAVTLEIGALRQVVPEALEFAFDAATEHTPAAGATLEWTEIPARVACLRCEHAYAPEDAFWLCPACGAAGGRVLQGEELILKSVTLDEPEAPGQPPEGDPAWKSTSSKK